MEKCEAQSAEVTKRSSVPKLALNGRRQEAFQISRRVTGNSLFKKNCIEGKKNAIYCHPCWTQR